MPFPKLVSSDTNISSYCDFIEYCCFAEDEIKFSDFDINDSTPSLDDIKKELKTRLDLYSVFIPFEIKRHKIKSLLKTKTDYLHYFYCLYYSLEGGTSVRTVTNIFEKISDISLKNYFCTNNSITTSIGQNNVLLKNAIDDIRNKLGESKGSDEYIPSKAKDGGIDIITFKPIDNRGNQVICLTDATIGKNWRTEKNVISQLSSWTEFIHFKVTPITCLAIVHIVAPEDFHSSSKSNGLLFDRTRIMKFYDPNSTINTELINWQTSL